MSKIVILTTSYNCENYIEKCLYSIMSQNHKDFVCYITDDMSTDSTVDKIKSIISNDKRFVLIQNTEKLYQPGNYDTVIRNNEDINNNDICVEVDGDDWLPDSSTLKRIYEVYLNSDVWMSSGSFKYTDGTRGFAKAPELFQNVRHQSFTLTHMRCWRAGLWREIQQNDLKDENGKYWEVAGDLSFMYPMFEMSGEKHFKFIEDINYVYNETNPMNDHKVNMGKVNEIVSKIRNKKSYNLINGF
jgi:glycosyltransferase involved in cell wall biosynthesis